MNKKKTDKIHKRGLKRQLTVIYVCVMAATLFLCWLVNNLFLEKFYVHDKEKTLYKTYSVIKDECVDNNLSSTDFDITLEKLSGTHNVSIVIISDLRLPIKVFASEPHDEILLELQRNLSGTIKAERVIEQNDDYVFIERKDARTQTDYLEMWGVLPDGSFFLMRTAVESIKVSVDIANRFLLYTGLGGIIISAIVIYIVSRRVSDLEDAYASLYKENEVKTQIDEMRKEFISNVSHELKTPIALIQGYAEGLKEGINEDEERDYYCDVIVDESLKMNEIVKKLLTLNQLEFGSDILSKEAFDLSSLVKDFVQSSEVLTNQNGIKVSVTAIEDVYVYADEYKIEDVFANYFSNAINHCQSDEQKLIAVEVGKRENRAYVSVYNTGSHIPDDSFNRIWEKFYKVDKARTREYGGSGVGLSIVKAVIEAHGGEYGVENVENGVKFWFTLDLVEDET